MSIRTVSFILYITLPLSWSIQGCFESLGLLLYIRWFLSTLFVTSSCPLCPKRYLHTLDLVHVVQVYLSTTAFIWSLNSLYCLQAFAKCVLHFVPPPLGILDRFLSIFGFSAFKMSGTRTAQVKSVRAPAEHAWSPCALAKQALSKLEVYNVSPCSSQHRFSLSSRYKVSVP